MEEVVYLNGSLMPRSRASISPFDHGFLYGYGLFETMRAYTGRIFLLERHIVRLMEAAEVLGLAPALNGEVLRRACADTLQANGLLEARVRLTVSRGEVSGFPGTFGAQNPTVMVTASGYLPPSPATYEKGFNVLLSSFSRCSRSPLAGLKSASYLVNILARMEAESAGFDEALLLNERGCIAEGSVSNVFFIKGKSLLTPPLDSGILPGITRRVVMEIAPALGLDVMEKEMTVTDMQECDEAFLTNSMIEIVPLTVVKDGTGKEMVFGSGKPGEATAGLMAAYREKVKQETGKWD